MTWQQFTMARQLLVEEHIGSLIREEKRREDQKERETRKRLRGRER